MYETSSIIKACENHCIYISSEQAEKLSEYCALLTEANKSFNLTRNDSEEDMLIKNIVDCIFLAEMIKAGSYVADIGSGAGFPGIVISIMKDTEVIMIDSVGKKVDFINYASEKLGLKAKGINIRAEIIGREKEYRENFDIVTSRAVAPLNILIEYGIPLLKVKGNLLAMKGKKAAEEAKNSENALKSLNCEIIQDRKYILKREIEHHILKIEKKGKSPEEYPRNTKKIIKEPL